MLRLSSGDAKRRLVASVALAVLALAVAWLWLRESTPQSARDFEACAEQVQASAQSKDERSVSMRDCSTRFAGRRKPGGGYSYYDFMQDRNFDIAGPNPTPAERKKIDEAYMGFLDTQRQEAVLAELAKRQHEKLLADLERARQPIGPPLALTPRTPSNAAARRPVDRSKSAGCEDGSLACSWSKFSAVLKNTFASSRTRP